MGREKIMSCNLLTNLHAANVPSSSHECNINLVICLIIYAVRRKFHTFHPSIQQFTFLKHQKWVNK